MLFSTDEGATDPLYLAFLSDPKLAEPRAHLATLWDSFSPFADSHFLAEAKRDFYARYWELFLFGLFTQNGHELQPHSDYGPDLQVRLTSGKRLWVEAVTPGPGEGEDAVPPRTDSGAAFVPSEQIVLRLRSVIRDKIVKITEYRRSGIIADGDYVLLAVNPGKIRLTMADAEPSFALQCVYPLGAPYVAFDPATGAARDGGYSHRDTIHKKSGAPVSTAVFIDPANAVVSGMLYSPLLPFYIHSVGSSYGKACRLVHNGVATLPFDGPLQIEGEARAILKDSTWELTWSW